MAVRQWTSDEDAIIVATNDLPLLKVAELLNRSVNAVRGRRSQIGAAQDRFWSDEDTRILIAAYTKAGTDRRVNLVDLAHRLNRNKANVSRKAASIGLTDARRRPTQDQSEAAVHRLQAAIAKNGHPRGMLGKQQQPDAIARTASNGRITRAKQKIAGEGVYSEDARQRSSDAMMERHVTHPTMSQKGHSNGASGFREDLGLFVRSGWEANYARYLNWLVQQRQIVSWEYEAATFWFEKIKRGVRSYKPDFEIVNLDGSVEYHEVKGYDYPRGRTARTRMALYFPDVKLVLIDKDGYKAISEWKAMIPDWETQRKRPIVIVDEE